MSTLFVDTINEKTTNNGVYIPGHVINVQSAKAQQLLQMQLVVQLYRCYRAKHNYDTKII